MSEARRQNTGTCCSPGSSGFQYAIAASATDPRIVEGYVQLPDGHKGITAERHQQDKANHPRQR